MEILSLLFFIGVLIFLAFYDLKYRIIPNKVVYPTVIITLILILLSPEISVWMALLSASVLGLLLLIPAILLKNIGTGDVKLAFVIGLMTGFPEGIIALFGGIFLGGLAAIFLVLLKIKSVKDEMPYAPFLASGAIAILLGGRYIMEPLLEMA